MEHLLPVVDQVLSGLGITLQEIDAFAVAVGPGSFTSLRVGLATAKAFAHALRKPLTGRRSYHRRRPRGRQKPSYRRSWHHAA